MRDVSACFQGKGDMTTYWVTDRDAQAPQTSSEIKGKTAFSTANMNITVATIKPRERDV